MNGADIPDSWDDGSATANGDMSQQLSGLSVTAKPFVPNVDAVEFVPSFMKKSVNIPSVDENASSKPPCQSSNSGGDVIEDNQREDVITTEETLDESIESINDATNEAESLEMKLKDEVNDDDDEVLQGDGEVLQDDDEVLKDDEVEEASVKTVSNSVPVAQSSVANSKEEHVNVVFIGHVDAGKSTIGGQIMYLTGMVDKRTLEKYEREAKEKNRETWYLSWALDTNQEERDKGKTVEVGRAYFETATKHFTILDAPGHRSFVPNMIGGTSQADIAVLVISARRGEFETGFERGGQTREHAMLAKTAGVQRLIVLINKMDDPTVKWSQARYEECKDKLLPFLKKVGFNPKKDVHFMPCSGMTGVNLKEPDTSKHPWYTDLALIPYLDSLPLQKRSPAGPLRLPIVDRYKDMGVIVLGKVESGSICKGQQLILQPNKRKIKVLGIVSDEVETDSAIAGENVKVRIDSVEEEEISKGFVLCTPDSLCSTGSVFDAQIVIIEYKSIICAGYSAILHIHTCVEEVVIKQLICLIDRKTGEKKKTRFVKQDQTVIARLQTQGQVCIETFANFPQMGRFTLRDENHTIAIGKVLKLIE